MDNLDRLLDAIEHPEAYTAEELEQILNEADCADALKILDSTDAALTDVPEPDTDAEWAAFSKKFTRRPQRHRRAVAAIIVAAISVAAVATGLGVYHFTQTEPQELAAESTPATAELPPVQLAETAPAAVPTVKVFENATLEDILGEMGKAYGMEVVFKSDSARGLRLFFRWDSNLTAAEVVELLNSFEQIDIHTDGRTITVE